MPPFLLDENVPRSVRDVLSRKGFQTRLAIDIVGIGARNSDLVDAARRADEIILTFDADFLRLRPELRRVVKVIYVDIHPRDPRETAHHLDQWIQPCLELLKQGNIVRLAKTGPTLESP